MAVAIARRFEQGGILLVEAGTGTGKTLSYLVPALLCGQRVLISTGTKNLQEQIVSKDLPILREALGREVAVTCMKGRGNYLCLHRFDQLTNDPVAQLAVPTEDLAVLDEWARSTETGDRAEVVDLPEELPYWRSIAATAETCLGLPCPRHADCFVTRMRQQAAGSDLVVVNHHLLCADAAVRQGAYGEVIPECAFAVIDEAHQLEEVATSYFGISVSTTRLEALVRDTDRVARGGVRLPEVATSLGRTAMHLKAASMSFFAALDQVEAPRAAGSLGSEQRARVTSDSLADAHETGSELVDALETLERTALAAASTSPDVENVGRRAAECRDQLMFLLRASDPDYVYFVERRSHSLALRAAPIDVSGILREVLFDRMQATVLTSATLSVGDSFEYMRRRLGIRDAEQLCLPSEYDHARQAILYLPDGMPDPRAPGFAAAVASQVVEILKRTAGRAFVLFTSHAMLRAVQPVVEAELPYPVLVQGEAPRSALLQQFRDITHSVLLATSSFWQGVDVVGESLSCVIVDRLPFASPGDPITAARIEAVAAGGGDPFSEFQLPLAVLTLRQGLGRLIRHRRDRGVLAVLDPRLRTRSYGARFLDALPPAPRTSSLEDIERFFGETSAA